MAAGLRAAAEPASCPGEGINPELSLPGTPWSFPVVESMAQLSHADVILPDPAAAASVRLVAVPDVVNDAGVTDVSAVQVRKFPATDYRQQAGLGILSTARLGTPPNPRVAGRTRHHHPARTQATATANPEQR